MTDDQKLKEIISMLTFLQFHIKNKVKASFTDLTFDLEAIIMNFLNVFEKGEGLYKNKNEIKHNYPAIDLDSEKKDIAIQVTTNADAAKVKKTIETYVRHKLTYKELIVIGFINHTKKKFTGVKVVGIEYLIYLAKHGNSNQKDMIYDILHRYIPLNILHTSDDKMAFDVVFDVINRSAVRDMTAAEGNFDHMVSGLKEIKEIITTGAIKGKSIRAKALVEYTSSLHDNLSDIDFDVSRIIQITNTAKNRNSGGHIMLNQKEKEEIDTLKKGVIDKTNKIAANFGLSKRIR